MIRKSTPAPTCLTRMQHQSWQRQLRASVRLYLALGMAEPSLLQVKKQGQILGADWLRA